jgi:hypothetical protein
MLISSLLRSVAVVAMFAVVGCAGGPNGGAMNSVPSTGSVPASAPISRAQSEASLASPDGSTAIQSSCGRHIRVVLLSTVMCRFTEVGYTGEIDVANDASGIVTVDPATGTTKTRFNVTAVLLGSGYLYVTDALGHHLKVYVRVKPSA